MRISDWSSDVCSSDLEVVNAPDAAVHVAGMQAVREDVAAAYAADPRLKDLTDAGKQEAASIMASMATVAAASANQLRSDGDQDGPATPQDEVPTAAHGPVLDLAPLRLPQHIGTTTRRGTGVQS